MAFRRAILIMMYHKIKPDTIQGKMRRTVIKRDLENLGVSKERLASYVPPLPPAPLALVKTTKQSVKTLKDPVKRTQQNSDFVSKPDKSSQTQDSVKGILSEEDHPYVNINTDDSVVKKPSPK
jgi:hypothetical protein